MIVDEVKRKLEIVCDEVVDLAEKQAVNLIVNKHTRTLRDAFRLSGCCYHSKRDQKKYRQLQMRAKRQDKKRAHDTTEKVLRQVLKRQKELECELKELQTELRNSLQRQKQLERDLHQSYDQQYQYFQQSTRITIRIGSCS